MCRSSHFQRLHPRSPTSGEDAPGKGVLLTMTETFSHRGRLHLCMPSYIDPPGTVGHRRQPPILYKGLFACSSKEDEPLRQQTSSRTLLTLPLVPLSRHLTLYGPPKSFPVAYHGSQTFRRSLSPQLRRDPPGLRLEF